MQDLYFQDNQDCNSSTFKLRVQENRDFSGTLLQDLCVTTTQDCTGTFSQDFCGQDTSEFTSKLDHTYCAQGATSGFVEPFTVAVLTSSTNTCDLLVLLVARILQPRSCVQRVPLALTWLGFTSGFLLLVYPVTKD